MIKKRILITGATGYIGANLLKILSKKYDVFCISKTKEKEKNVKWIKMDLRKINLKKLPSRIDYIIHLAQSRNYKKYLKYANDIFEVNTLSTYYLLKYGKKIGIEKFLYTSTGNIDNYLDNFYVSTKYMSELLLGHYKKHFIPIILRLYTVYGPNQKGKLVSNLIENIKKNKIIFLENKKEGIKLTPTYISDTVKAIYKSLDLTSACTLDVAGKETVSIKSLALLIGKILNKKPKFKKIINKNAQDLMPNTKRLKFIPKTSLIKGLRLSI